MQLRVFTSPPATRNNDFNRDFCCETKEQKKIEKSCMLVGRSIERDRVYLDF